jgi:hypothetical protein
VVVRALEALQFEMHSSGYITNFPVVIVLPASNEVECNVPHADKCITVCHC